MTLPTHVYTGRGTCGCIRFVTVDDPDDPSWVARTVADAIRSGLSVERVPFGEYTLARCPHQDRQERLHA